MLVFDVFYHKIVALEDLFANFTTEDFAVVIDDLFTLVLAKIFDVLIDEFLSWINRFLWPILDPLDSLADIPFQKSDAASPLGTVFGLQLTDVKNWLGKKLWVF